MKSVSFVIPWYGPDIPGGAEAECRHTALNLHRRGIPVQILTTCARDHASGWENFYREGVYEDEGMTVRRFRVRPRNAARFAWLNGRILRGEEIGPKQQEEFIRESIHSDGLYDYLDRERERHWYFFIPYLFGTTIEGSRVAPDSSYLIPCLHDEGYAYFHSVREMLRRVRGVIFHTRAEMRLAQRITGLGGENFYLLGEGIDTNISGDAARFRRRWGIREPFLLYAGRKSEQKNLPLLVGYFARLRMSRLDLPLKLVLMGSGSLPLPPALARDVVDLGYVPPQEKYDAYAAASVLVQPSLMESFSLVLMEAWLCGTPVLVHGGCEVTREHCEASNGGLWFSEYFEFLEAVCLFLTRPELGRRMAEAGRRFVLENFCWEIICRRYQELLQGRFPPASQRNLQGATIE